MPLENIQNELIYKNVDAFDSFLEIAQFFKKDFFLKLLFQGEG